MSVSVFNNPNINTVPSLHQHIQQTKRAPSVFDKLLNSQTSSQPNTVLRQGFEAGVAVFPDAKQDCHSTMNNGVLQEAIGYKREMLWTITDFIRCFGPSYFPKVAEEYTLQCKNRKEGDASRNSALSGDITACLTSMEKKERYKRVLFRVCVNDRDNQRGVRYLYFGPFLFFALAYRERFMGGSVEIPSRNDLITIFVAMFEKWSKKNAGTTSQKTVSSKSALSNSIIGRCVYEGILAAAHSADFKAAAENTPDKRPEFWTSIADFLGSDCGRSSFPKLYALYSNSETKSLYYEISSAISRIADWNEVKDNGFMPSIPSGSSKRYNIYCLYYIFDALEHNIEQIKDHWTLTEDNDD